VALQHVMRWLCTISCQTYEGAFAEAMGSICSLITWEIVVHDDA